MSYTYQYPHPAIAADCVVFGYDGKDLQLLLIERKNDPCKGMWAFPGGFMEINETAEAAARRELKEETGLEVPALMPFGSFSTVRRDPRERVVSIAYYTVIEPTTATGGDDARMAAWFPIGELPPLAFDHDEILIKAFLQMWKDISTEPEFWAMPVHPEMTDMLLWHCKKALFTPLLRTVPDLIQNLKPHEIFVFGSNLQGMHGGGAAYIAVKKFGAVMGQGVGLQGQSYAIPTMQGGVETIAPYTEEFIGFARQHPELTFLVTRIGCGIAGFRDEEIAPLFRNAVRVPNIRLPESFWNLLGEE